MRLAQFALTVVIATSAIGVQVQSEEALVEAYERAAFIENNGANRYHVNSLVVPVWIGETDSFWYRRETADGYRFTRVDATAGSTAPLFDHARLARLLQESTERKIDPDKLALRGLAVESDGGTSFAVFEKSFRYSANGILSDNGAADSLVGLVVAPDGTNGVFLRDHNLWLKNIESSEERALTSDGSALYATACRQMPIVM